MRKRGHRIEVAPEMAHYYELRRAKGGHVAHVVPQAGLPDEAVAVCGFRPSSPRSRYMVQRHGWVKFTWQMLPCPSCKALAPMMFEVPHE